MALNRPLEHLYPSHTSKCWGSVFLWLGVILLCIDLTFCCFKAFKRGWCALLLYIDALVMTAQFWCTSSPMGQEHSVSHAVTAFNFQFNFSLSKSWLFPSPMLKDLQASCITELLCKSFHDCKSKLVWTETQYLPNERRSKREHNCLRQK